MGLGGEPEEEMLEWLERPAKLGNVNLGAGIEYARRFLVVLHF
jgi:hypothetical protein